MINLETSQTAHFERFIQNGMSSEKVSALIRTVWAAGVAHGTRMTNLAHEVLDREPLVLTNELSFPIMEFDLVAPHRSGIDPYNRVKYLYHYQAALKILAGMRQRQDEERKEKKWVLSNKINSAA